VAFGNDGVDISSLTVLANGSCCFSSSTFFTQIARRGSPQHGRLVVAVLGAVIPGMENFGVLNQNLQQATPTGAAQLQFDLPAYVGGSAQRTLLAAGI